MIVRSLFNDMLIIAVFMLAGYLVRELVKPLQRLFLPASLIGGVIALVLGHQCLGYVEIPGSFSEFSNVLIAPIMAALMFGVTITRDKVVGYLDYILVEQGIYGMQMALGALIGIVLGGIWPGLPAGWGSLAQFAFQGGHGNAAAAGEVYLEYGVEGNISVGMVLATFGLIVAMSCGMIMVGITILMAFGLSYLFCRDQWFEKALMAYGVGTGNTATGLALVRAVDPDSLSDAPDSHGIYSAVCSWKEIFISLIPMWMVSGGAMIVVGIGGLICGVCVILGFIMFGITKKSNGGAKDQ